MTIDILRNACTSLYKLTGKVAEVEALLLNEMLTGRIEDYTILDPLTVAVKINHFNNFYVFPL